jgi:hypothetical protein
MYPWRRTSLIVVLTLGMVLVSGGVVVAQEDPGSPIDWSSVPTVEPVSFSSGSATGDVSRAIEPAVAGGLSVLIPGGGQFYNGQNVKGSLMLLGFAASVVYAVTAGLGDREICAGDVPHQVCNTHSHWPNSRFWIGLGSAGGVQAWSILDAVAVANRRVGR